MTSPTAGAQHNEHVTCAPPRRVYSTPRLTVHGTLAELTASDAGEPLLVSGPIGG